MVVQEGEKTFHIVRFVGGREDTVVIDAQERGPACVFLCQLRHDWS